MTIDPFDVFRRGGKKLIDLLEYCVLSVQTDPIFLFLVEEYRTLPTKDKATAVVELFCKEGLPCRIGARRTLPPYDLMGLASITAALRAATPPPPSPDEGQEPPRPAPPIPPPKFLFDAIALEVREDPRGQLARLTTEYDPAQGPHASLPGGTLTPAQRHFLDNVWRPLVRPRLVTSGFRRLSNVAG